MNVWVKHGQLKIFHRKIQNLKLDRVIKVQHHHFHIKVIVHLMWHFDQAVVSENNHSLENVSCAHDENTNRIYN